MSTKHDNRPRLPNVDAGRVALQRDDGSMSRIQLTAVADATSEVTEVYRHGGKFYHLIEGTH
jgi:hypothetical protein